MTHRLLKGLITMGTISVPLPAQKSHKATSVRRLTGSEDKVLTAFPKSIGEMRLYPQIVYGAMSYHYSQKHAVK